MVRARTVVATGSCRGAAVAARGQRLMRGCLLASLLMPAQALADTAPGGLPIVRLDVGGLTPHEIGGELARLWRQHFPDLEQRLDGLLAARLSTGVPLPSVTAPVDVALEAVELAAEEQEALRGLASGLDLVPRSRLGDGSLSAGELMLVQRLADLGLQGAGAGFGVFGGRAGGGGALVGRNLDRPRGVEVEPRLDTISVYRADEISWVSVGPAGSLAVTTGFNDRGVFMAVIPAGGVPAADALASAAVPVGFALRRALGTARSIEAAARELRLVPAGGNHSVLLGEQGQVQVLERFIGDPGRLRSASSTLHPTMPWERQEQIAVVGCFALAMTPSDCHDVRHRLRWQRFRQLAGFEPGGPQAQLADVMRILLDRQNRANAINGDRTRQVLVYAAETGEAVLRQLNRPRADDEQAAPITQRLSGLLERRGAEREGVLGAWALLWLAILGLLVATLWVRLRADRRALPSAEGG